MTGDAWGALAVESPCLQLPPTRQALQRPHYGAPASAAPGKIEGRGDDAREPCSVGRMEAELAGHLIQFCARQHRRLRVRSSR